MNKVSEAGLLKVKNALDNSSLVDACSAVEMTLLDLGYSPVPVIDLSEADILKMKTALEKPSLVEACDAMEIILYELRNKAFKDLPELDKLLYVNEPVLV